MEKSAVFVPESVACAMPVRVAVPVLVSVNTWVGSRAQAACWSNVVPGQFRAWVTVQGVGVSVA